MCKHYEDSSESCTRKLSKEDMGRIRHLLAVAELDALSEPLPLLRKDMQPLADGSERVPTVKLPPAVWMSSYKAQDEASVRQPSSMRVASLADLHSDSVPVLEIVRASAPPQAKTSGAGQRVNLPTADDIDVVFSQVVATTAPAQTLAIQPEPQPVVVQQSPPATRRPTAFLSAAALALAALGGLLVHLW